MRIVGFVVSLTGLLKDDSKTLSDIKVVKGTKMMMLGKNMQAITKLQSPNNKSSSSSSAVSDGPKSKRKSVFLNSNLETVLVFHFFLF